MVRLRGLDRCSCVLRALNHHHTETIDKVNASWHILAASVSMLGVFRMAQLIHVWAVVTWVEFVP